MCEKSDDYPRCLYCGEILGKWAENRYFCQNINCPLWYRPAETTVEVSTGPVTAVTTLDELPKALASGWFVLNHGVGYREPTDF